MLSQTPALFQRPLYSLGGVGFSRFKNVLKMPSSNVCRMCFYVVIFHVKINAQLAGEGGGKEEKKMEDSGNSNFINNVFTIIIIILKELILSILLVVLNYA